jgi:hypothetical protein
MQILSSVLNAKERIYLQETRRRGNVLERFMDSLPDVQEPDQEEKDKV